MSKYPDVHILIVEDKSFVALIEANILKSFGCQVDIAETGEKALELLAKNYYHLVFMDIGLPDTSGHAVTEMLRSKVGPNRDTPVVALTAHDELAHRNHAIWVGMNDYLEKPLTPQDCERILNKFLSKFSQSEKSSSESKTEWPSSRPRI